jgi:phenylacetaldehyde dehydrogenase
MPASPNLLPETAAFLARSHQLLIGGEWVDAQGSDTLTTLNPADEQPLAEFAAAGAADVDLAVDAARNALESGPWARLGPSARGALLWRLADAIETHADVFAQLEVLDNGMPLNPAASMAAPGAAKMLRYYAGWPTKIMGRTIPAEIPPDASQPSLIYTRREPVGVVAQIIPWNYPLGMAAMKLGPALAAGCTVILKPDERTPLSALLLGELIRQVGFPPGVVNILPGEGARAGAALAAHAGVNKIAFTGSTATGKDIVRAAAGNLKRVSLELGGKAPFIILPDADLDRAIATAARLGFFLQGQNCQCPSRLIVHADVYDRVVEEFVAAALALPIGPGWDPAIRMGPLISAQQLERVAGYIESGKREKASLLTGGQRVDRPGYFLEPTVFAETRAEMRISREEIFGPVIAIQRCEDNDLDKLSAIANDTNYGLVASVWTRDLRLAHGLAERIRSGVVGINHHGSADIYAPFGGFKESGWAREFGPDSLEPYLETKSVVVRYD